MNEQPDPAFDTVHPSGAIMFRSSRGGCLHSVTLTEQAMQSDASSLAEGILRTASVSFLRAAMEIRAEVVAAQPDEGAQDLPTKVDLDKAIEELNSHVLPYRND